MCYVETATILSISREDGASSMSEQVDFLKYRALLREYGYELCRRGNTVYLRLRPKTRDEPTPGMVRARNVLSLVSSGNRGTTGFEPTGLPSICIRNREGIISLSRLLKGPESKRVLGAKAVADAIGLESLEKAELVRLIRRTRP